MNKKEKRAMKLLDDFTLDFIWGVSKPNGKKEVIGIRNKNGNVFYTKQYKEYLLKICKEENPIIIIKWKEV